ncbi:MAG: DUF4350 domain-containing protein [Halanaerobiales bacterium]
MKKNREIIWFILLIPVILYGAFYLSTMVSNPEPNYSVLNKSLYGCSVFYEALQELGYPVKRTEKPVESFDHKVLQIVASRTFASFDVYDSAIEEWVKGGGKLVYLNPDQIYMNWNDFSLEQKGQIEIYQLGEGQIIVSDLDYISNINLLKETENAYRILEVISDYDYKQIYFNESHLYKATPSKTWWDVVPMSIKFIFYQLLFSLLAYFYYKGKRFGKPLIYSEEEERIENEYLYSAASLYKQAGSWDLILENYYQDFLKQLGYSEDEWLNYWKREDLPLLSKAERVYRFMESIDESPDRKDAIHIINIIEELKSHLKKRRDQYWKSLKK